MDDCINVWTGGNFRNRSRDANGATIIVADDTDDPEGVVGDVGDCVLCVSGSRWEDFAGFGRCDGAGSRA